MLKGLLNKALNGAELMELANEKTNIYKYRDLKNISSIDELLDPYDSAVILYESITNYGHWTCLIKRDNNILEFFDSYGIFPDQELNNIDKDFRTVNNMKIPYLSYLLIKSPYELQYNNYMFQAKSKNISTCGRWVGYRILKKNISTEEFKNIFDDKILKPDEIICLKTFYID